MNKRFRELTNEARQYSIEKIENPQDPTTWSVYNDIFEKRFAELIVKECVENFNEVWYEQGLDIRGADHAEFMAQFIQKFWC